MSAFAPSYIFVLVSGIALSIIPLIWLFVIIMNMGRIRVDGCTKVSSANGIAG